MAKRTEETTAKTSEAQASQGTGATSSSPYAAMLKQAAKLQTAYRTGADLSIPSAISRGNSSGPGGYNYGQVRYVVPGIAVYNWYPTAGVATRATDPVNMAIKSIYAFVRSANSGARNYQPSDLFIYTTALDSIYSLYYQIIRVMGLLNTFTEHNVYYPRAIVRALGFDYDDFVEHQPAILFQLANWAAKLKQFSLPSSMRVYQDHRDMNTTVYTDGDTDRSQMYAFAQDGFWTYEVVDEVKGLTLRKLADFETSDIVLQSENQHYVATWYATKGLFNAMLEAFLNSDDVALISGDITKAYQVAGFVELPIIDSTYITPIGKSDLMLNSIMNADVIAVDPATCRVQDSPDALGYVVCQPGFNLVDFWINTARNYAAFKAANPDATGWDNPAALNFTNDFSYPAQAGNTYWENFVSDNPTEDEMVAALRFRVWVDETSITFNSMRPQDTDLFDGRTSEEYTLLNNMLSDFTDKKLPIRACANYKLKYCGTEILHDCYIASLLPTTGNFNTAGATYALGGAYHAPTFTPTTYVAATMTANTTATSAPVYSNGSVSGQMANVMNIFTLAAFDWHHRVYCADTNSVNAPAGVNDISIPCFDPQNVVPIGEANIQQFIDAALYYAFFG